MCYLQVSDVIKNGPGLHVEAFGLNEMVVDSMESQRQWLEEHEQCHQVMDLVHIIPPV